MALFLEDFVVGQRFVSPVRALEGLAEFGTDLGAQDGAASPMAVASATMRLLVESEFAPSGGIMGAGIEALHWPAATRVGARLRVVSEVLEVRASKSRPEKGLVRLRTETLDEGGSVVQSMLSTVVAPARG